MKQILIVFVLIIFATASSDLLKSLSKFADNGDSSSKFAKSTVSPFSEEESEDYDSEDTEPSKKMAPKSQQDDNDDEVDVMAQLKSYQQKLSTSKDVKPPQQQKKQVQVISESESEYDDEEDSGNMWSRGISKKLAQTESKPLVLPIQSAKEQIKNDYNQFTSLKMPEVQQRPQETKSQDQTQKVQEDPGKEHSADFEKMKQAQLEKYSKRFHLDEPKESKSMYEDDSLKEFMPKINFQPINIQETKTSQQVQSNPEKRQENKHDESESEDDEEEDSVEINKKSSLQSKISNKVTIDQKPNTDAFDFFNQSKQQQKSNKKSQRIEESEDEESESAQEVEDDEDYVQQVKKNKKQKEDKEEQKRKQKQLQQQQEEEEEQRRLMLKKQKEQQIQQEELRKKQEEEERQQELAKQQKLKRDSDEDQIPQKKKSKKQKKQLSLEEFQQSLKVDEEKPQLTSFAQKEAKEKAILEQKTFTLVKETPQQVQEQKVFKLQAVPKKQQQLIQEEESEGESESEDDNIDTPKSINCFESKNKFIQQICQLCQTKVAYQVNQQNWQKIGINDGFRQSFEPLIEFTFKSIGEVGSYYLSFKDHTVCLSAENLTKMTNVDKVLKHFTGNQLADYNSPVDIPAKSQPINFLLSAEYDSLLNGFSCRRFQIAIKTDLKYKLSKKNDINVKQIIFYKNKLKLKYIGLIQINGVVHQASFDQEEGGEVTNLIVTQLNLPKEQGVIASLVDKYVDSNFVADMLQKSEQMMADLQIQTHIKNDDIGLTFNLRKRKGK